MTPGAPVEFTIDVLVVDDNASIRMTMRFALEDAGYTVYEAADGVQALNRLRTHPHGLVVLLDLNLPKLDGWGVLRAVAAEKPLATPHRFLLLTAKSDELPAALIKLLRRLHAPVITKPCSLDRIFDAVAGAAAAINAQEAPSRASAY
jgi:CheY-like chemotaxis protein